MRIAVELKENFSACLEIKEPHVNHNSSKERVFQRRVVDRKRARYDFE